MAPDHVKRWMQHHLKRFGPEAMGEMCLPGSHDAGHYKLEHSTNFGTRSNVITQTLSIYQQLEHGVRWFDIRPFLVRDRPDGPDSWWTGHFSGLEAPLNWQGGCGASIDEVINDVNNFTMEHAELVILDISHVTHLLVESTGRQLDLTDDHRRDLLNKLGNIQHIFRASSDTRSSVRLDALPLNDFIGHGQAAVVVLFEDGFTHLDLHGRGFFTEGQYKVLNHYITAMQSDSAAILSSLNPFQVFGPGSNSFSVLSIAKSLHDAEFPFALQERASAIYPSVLTIDNVGADDKLFNLSLAISYQRFNIAHNLKNHVVVYGGQLITDPGMHTWLQECIDAPRGFPITNENLRGDPWSGLNKSCAIYYWQDGWAKGRFAPEHSSLQLERDIKHIEYGGVDVKNQVAYYTFWRALVKRDIVKIDNTSLGGDPRVGQVKKCKVRFRELNGSSDEEYEAEEGKYINFKTFWERFAEGMSNGQLM